MEKIVLEVAEVAKQSFDESMGSGGCYAQLTGNVPLAMALECADQFYWHCLEKLEEFVVSCILFCAACH